MKKFLNVKQLLIVAFVIINTIGYSQQEAQYTQYMYNMSQINPAYATTDLNRINLGGLYRMQWVGAVGGPETGTFFIHTPFSERVELGLSVIHDNIGDGVLKQTNITGDFAYVIELEDNFISFGLKAGVSLLETNFNGFQLSDPIPDPTFAQNISKAFPTLGVGAFYFSDNYYIGLSTPNIIKNEILENSDGIYATGVQELHGYLTAGYVFELNDQFKIKPAFLTKATKNAPVSVDLTANVLYNERFELGVAYRINDSFSGLFNVRVLDQLRIGYAYDHTLSNMGRFNSGSHEVVVLFDLFKNNRGRKYGYDKSPRFF